MRTQACNNLGPTRFIAPSPSGKAPDSDSGIGGSNPSGAAKHERSDLTIGPFCCPTASAQHSGNGARAQPAPRSNSDRRRRRPTPPSSGRDAAPARRGTTRRTGHSQAAPRPPRAGAATAATCYEMTTQRLRKPPGPAKETCLATQHIAGTDCRRPLRRPKTTKARHGRALKQAPRRTGTQQTRWISAWRTGSRDGPCADRPSYARLRERHGS